MYLRMRMRELGSALEQLDVREKKKKNCCLLANALSRHIVTGKVDGMPHVSQIRGYYRHWGSLSMCCSYIATQKER